jgi:hypothetical protein
MADDPTDRPDSGPGSGSGHDDGQQSWAHKVTVGAALMVVSVFFLPEGIGALGGDSGSFMWRADDGEPDVFFGTALVLLGSIMLAGGVVFIVRGLRQRKAETHG